MEKINDGGPAFPMVLEHGDGAYTQVFGMSLRDYFAAAALTGILASYSNEQHINSAAVSAKEAYQRADAMIAARNAGDNGNSK